jgi:phage shock protein E
MRYLNWSILFVLLLGGIVAGFSLCSESLAEKQELVKTSGVITAVTPEEAQQLIRQRKDLMVVDVRTLRERKRTAIAGSIHIPMGEIFQNKISWPRDRPMLLYCAVGGRSSTAADWLQKQGFTEIYNLVGGILEWQKQGLPIVTGK